jgi:uroporphyrinogen-III decarboxylase
MFSPFYLFAQAMIEHDQERARRMLVENPEVTRALFRVSSRVCAVVLERFPGTVQNLVFVCKIEIELHVYYKW